MTWNKFTSWFFQETKSRLQQTLYSTNQWLPGPAIRVRSLIAPIQLILAAKSTLVGKILVCDYPMYPLIVGILQIGVELGEGKSKFTLIQLLLCPPKSRKRQKNVKKGLLFRLLWTKVLPKPKNDGSILPSTVTKVLKVTLQKLKKSRKIVFLAKLSHIQLNYYLFQSLFSKVLVLVFEDF